jgi:uncharacterized protein with LGFP repeats
MKFVIAAFLGLVAVQAVTVDDYFTVQDHESHYYDRITTPRFAADSDDIFMRSMIEQYALEEKTKVVEHDDGTKTGGEPSGKFWMNKQGAFAASSEVLNTHKGLSGNALKAYTDTYFEKAWGHFDVNQVGTIEVIKMPQFMRFLCSDQYMSLGESG